MLVLFLILPLLIPSALGDHQQVDHFAVMEILWQCWQHPPVVVLDPEPMKDEMLYKVFVEKSMTGRADVAFFQASSLTTMSDLMTMANAKGLRFLLVFNAKSMALLNPEQNGQNLDHILSKMTWAFPSSFYDLGNYEERLDSKILFYSVVNNEILITERFGFKSNVSEHNKIGWMNPNHTIECSHTPNFDKRRTEHLRNKTLHFASVTPHLKDPESVQEAQRKGIVVSGAGLVARELLYDVGLETGLTLKETSLYDTTFFEGRNLVWDSVLTMLVEDNTIDLVCENYGMTVERKKKMEFTAAINPLKIPFYVRARDQTALDLTTYFRIFTLNLWLGIVLILASTALILTLIDSYLLGERLPKAPMDFLYSFSIWFWKLLLQLIQKSSIDLSHSMKKALNQYKTARIKSLLLLLISCLSYVLFSLYVSDLTSVLSSPRPLQPKIQKAKDLLLPSVEIGLGGPLSLSFLEGATEGTVWKDIYLRKLANKNVDYVYSTEEIRDFLLSHEYAVFMGLLELENFQMLKSTGTEILSSYSKTLDGAFPIPKNSSVQNILSFHVRKLAEGGITTRRTNAWTKHMLDFTHLYNKGHGEGHGVVRFSHVIFPFLIVLLGVVCSLVVMCIEKMAFIRFAK